MTLSFHNDPAIKEFYVNRAKAHYAADEIVKGTYWEGGKGCAVGCLVHGSSHSKLAEEIGIPLTMTYLIDRLFESQPNGESKVFPVRFIEAVPVGVDLSGVMDKYFHTLLSDPVNGAIAFANDKVRPSIQGVIHLYSQRIAGINPTSDEWIKARRAAVAAYAAAAYAAAADADADDAAYAAVAAAAAAADAAYAAVAAAYAAVAYAAAYAAYAAAAYAAADADAADADAAAAAARSNHLIWQAELLISLLVSAQPELVTA